MLGPVLFGFVFDNACLQWQHSCSERGSCWIYDNGALSRNASILAVIIKLCSASFFSLALYFYKPPTVSNTLNKSTDALNEAQISIITNHSGSTGYVNQGMDEMGHSPINERDEITQF